MKDISIKISQKRGKNVFFMFYSSQAMQSIIVADFTISVYGSSCNYHLFMQLLSRHLLYLSI